MDFESSFAGVRKTVNATESEFARLAQGMRDLAKTKPVDVNQLNKIGEMAGQLGIKKENILAFTGVVADLSVATNLTADQAGNAMARIANVMRMPLTNVDRMGSAIVALGNFGASTEQEMLDFATRIAGAGAVAGLTVPNILAIGNAFASAGIEAEAGGTAIQKALLKMVTAVSTGKDLAQFGNITGLGAEGFKKTFQQNPAEAFARFVEGLGKAGTAAIPLLQGVGFDDQRMIRAFLNMAAAGDLLRNSLEVGNKAWSENTALTRAAEQRYQTFANQIQLLWNNLRDTAITLGLELMPTLKSMVPTLQELLKDIAGAVKWFGDLPEPVKRGAIEFFALGAALGPVAYAFGTILKTSSALIAFLRSMPGLVRGVWGAIAAFPKVPGWVIGALGIPGATGAAIGVGGATLGYLTTPAYQDAANSGVMIDPSTGMVVPLGSAARQPLRSSNWGGMGAPAGLMVGVQATEMHRGAQAAAEWTPQISAASDAQNKFNDEVARFKAEFSGADIINRTNAMVIGLNQAGGASLLTADAFKRFKDDVKEAVDVMRARGEEIPRTWRAIAASVEGANRALETTKQLGEDLAAAVRQGSPKLLIPTVNGPVSQQADLLGQAIPGAPGTPSSTWAVVMRDMRDQAYTIADAIRDKFAQAFDQIPDLITRSLLHSGGFLNGLKAIGFQMADAIIEPFIREIIRKLALAKLGSKIASAVLGGGGSAIGGTLSNAGAAVGGAALLGGAGGGVAASVSGVEASIYGGAAGGGGVGAAIGGLFTNPITGVVAGAALGGFALYRHFSRGSRANDARDKFLAQFASFDNKRDESNPPGFYGLDLLLTKYKHHDLFTQLIGAKDPGKVKKAEKDIAAVLAVTGRSFHIYHDGGLVPGTGDVPAILQGGERVLSRDEAANYGGRVVNVNVTVQAMDGADVTRVFRRHIIPNIKRALVLNTDDLLTVARQQTTT
jgi:TP901 family phage tail tape measure protein